MFDFYVAAFLCLTVVSLLILVVFSVLIYQNLDNWCSYLLLFVMYLFGFVFFTFMTSTMEVLEGRYRIEKEMDETIDLSDAGADVVDRVDMGGI